MFEIFFVFFVNPLPWDMSNPSDRPWTEEDKVSLAGRG